MSYFLKTLPIWTQFNAYFARLNTPDLDGNKSDNDLSDPPPSTPPSYPLENNIQALSPKCNDGCSPNTFDRVPYLKLCQYIILKERLYHFEQRNGVERLDNGGIRGYGKRRVRRVRDNNSPGGTVWKSRLMNSYLVG